MTNSAERLKHLEEEGEVAADYLEEILDIMDLDGDIEIDVENDRPSVSIISENPNSNLNRLVGEDGEVLEALQELTRLAVQSSMGERSRLMLDVAGYRARRRAELQSIAAEAVAEVKETGEPVQLEPMNPFERKVCHDVVAAAGLASESAGSEPERSVVIFMPNHRDAAEEVPSQHELVEEGEQVDNETSEALADSGSVVGGSGLEGDLAAAEMAVED